MFSTELCRVPCPDSHPSRGEVFCLLMKWRYLVNRLTDRSWDETSSERTQTVSWPRSDEGSSVHGTRPHSSSLCCECKCSKICLLRFYTFGRCGRMWQAWQTFTPVRSNLYHKWRAPLLDDTLFCNWGSKTFLYCCHYKIEEMFRKWALSFWKVFYYENFQTSTKGGKKRTTHSLLRSLQLNSCRDLIMFASFIPSFPSLKHFELNGGVVSINSE